MLYRPFRPVLPGNLAVYYHNLSAKHVHPAGKANLSCPGGREIDAHGFIQWEFAFDVVFRNADLSTAGHLDLAQERQPDENVLPNRNAGWLVAIFGQENLSSLDPRLALFSWQCVLCWRRITVIRLR